MGQIGPLQIIIVFVLVVLLFGRGKISELMGDVAKGIKSFKKGLSDEEEPGAPKGIDRTAQDAGAEMKSKENRDRA